MNANRLTLSVVLAIGSMVTPLAHAITGCSNSTLNGNYALQFSGTSAPAVAGSIAGLALPAGISQSARASVSGGNSTVPSDGIVRLFLDGNGILLGSASVNLFGAWLQGNVSGQYTVNQDCSVSFSLSDPSGATGNFSGVVVGQGDTMLVLQTDAGTGVTGIFKRTRGACQTGDLSGTFGIQYNGTSAVDGSTYSSVGVLSLDGLGGVNGSESRFAGGNTYQATTTGSITINPDCSASVTLNSQAAPAQSLTFLGALSVDNKQLFLIESDTGMVAMGNMIAQ